VNYEWERTYGDTVRYFDETGKIVGYVEAGHRYQHWNACAYCRGSLGQYMTQEQAMRAVEQAVEGDSRG